MDEFYGVYNALGPPLAEHALDDMQLAISFASFALAGLLAAPLTCAATVTPSPASLGSDISLLYNNDLDGMIRHP